MGFRFLELLVFYGVLGGITRLLENQLYGAPYPQSWEFYAITFCLFLVLASPGFVVVYLWRPSRRSTVSVAAAVE
jgi:hypothetical protein